MPFENFSATSTSNGSWIEWTQFEEAHQSQNEVAAEETAVEEVKEELGKEFYRYGQNNS